MREDILAAALRVFRREGALRFTTQRVAEAAGVSVGSLYQYFPNKHALVHALHERAIEAGWDEARRLLDDAGRSPRERLRGLVGWFFRAEAAETALMGRLLRDAELFAAAAPGGRELQAAALARLTVFLREGAADLDEARASFLAGLVAATVEGLGKTLADRGLGPDHLDPWADACADMLADYCGLG